MGIKLGKHSFTGPIASIDDLKDMFGICCYCNVDNDFFIGRW